jgi:hypothetical protein
MKKLHGQIFSTPLILPAFLSLGGFTEEALQFCQTQGIATACRIEVF